MLTICSDKVIVCDVDDTLVYDTKPEDQDYEDGFKVDCNNQITYVWKDEEIIEQIKDFKNKGYFVILWTQSGYEWADAVAKKLDLTHLIDLALCKPTCYLDDLAASAWMKRIYKNKAWTKKTKI